MSGSSSLPSGRRISPILLSCGRIDHFLPTRFSTRVADFIVREFAELLTKREPAFTRFLPWKVSSLPTRRPTTPAPRRGTGKPIGSGARSGARLVWGAMKAAALHVVVMSATVSRMRPADFMALH